MKRIGLSVCAIALVVSMGLAAAWIWGQTASPVAAQSSDGDSDYSPAETILVVGQGSVRMEPDVARVSVGVETSGETVDAAVAENSARMESIMAALEAAGIDEKDIQTTNYSIQLDRYREPLATSGELEQPPITYRVSNMVNVTVRDLDSIGEVIDAVVEAGANSVWGVSFGLDDPSLAQDAARADAIADAQARAEALAELSGIAVGPVMSISEVVSGGGVPMPVMAEMAASGAGPISPGELEVTYRVQVTYYIER